METHKKYKWALTGLIIMIILNAATLLTIWLNQPDGRDWRHHKDGDRDRTGIHQFMKKELGLSDTQVESMATMRRTHFQEMKNLRDDLESYRRAYFDFIMSSDTENEQKRDSLLSQLTTQYIEVEDALYIHMSEMKTVLNQEQQQKFKQLMKDTFLHNDRRGKSNPQSRMN
jgi:Spy/CpxP family protein refolding chaperone